MDTPEPEPAMARACAMSIVLLVSVPLLAIALLAGCQSGTGANSPTLKVNNASTGAFSISAVYPGGQAMFGFVASGTQRCFTLPGGDSLYVDVSGGRGTAWFHPAQSSGWVLTITGSASAYQVNLGTEGKACKPS